MLPKISANSSWWHCVIKKFCLVQDHQTKYDLKYARVYCITRRCLMADFQSWQFVDNEIFDPNGQWGVGHIQECVCCRLFKTCCRSHFCVTF